MYYQLKWHHINLISIDATCNLIFQCMVFSSNWLHRLWRTAQAAATIDGCEDAFVMSHIKVDAPWKSNSQVLNLATQILFQWPQKPEAMSAFRTHCSLSICSGEHICFVQNKSQSSDMQVSRTRGEALHPLAGSITGLWQILILFYCSSRLRMHRPSNDFMQEEAEGQKQSHNHLTRSLDKNHAHVLQPP